MCIIAIKKKGVTMPDEQTINAMWYSNSDGAGVMWSSGNQVHIAKGFMTLKSFKSHMTQLAEEINLTDTSIVMHFRIGTHGDNIPENCHPFPVTENLSIMRKLVFKTHVGVAHNGIIPITPRKNISDTMEYILTQLAPLKQIRPDYYKNKACHKLIRNAIQSKMCFLDKSGEVHLIGGFETDKKTGITYSNSSYLPRLNYQKWDFWDNSFSDLECLPLMPLDLDAGYVIAESGQFLDAEDFLIDEADNVYMLDYDYCCAIPMKGYRALNHQSMPIRFDHDEIEFFEVLSKTLEHHLKPGKSVKGRI